MSAISWWTVHRQDGRSSTLTAPNGPSQATVMRVALAEAKLAPEEVATWRSHAAMCSP